MQLQRLTGLERQKILDELAELQKTIERLRAILGNDELLMKLVVDELKAARDRFGDDRRTTIIDESGEFRIEDLIADEDMAITVTGSGYIKRTPISTYRMQRRGGKGRIGMRTREEDFVSHLFIASTHAYIMIFSDRGRALLAAGPRDSRRRSGREGQGDRQSRDDGGRRADCGADGGQGLADRRGPAVRRHGDAQGRHQEDRPLALQQSAAPAGSSRWASRKGTRLSPSSSRTVTEQIFLGTRDGMAIRFEETDVRPMGRTAYGVRGITLREGDEVVAMEVVREGGTMMTVTQNGLRQAHRARRIPRCSRAAASASIDIQTSDRNGKVVGIAYVHGDDELMLISQQGKILRMVTSAIRPIGRATQGVRLIGMEEGRSGRVRRAAGGEGSGGRRDERGRGGCERATRRGARELQRRRRHEARGVAISDRATVAAA